MNDLFGAALPFAMALSSGRRWPYAAGRPSSINGSCSVGAVMRVRIVTRAASILIVAALALLAPVEARAQAPVDAGDCATVDACVSILRTFGIKPSPAANYRSSAIDPKPIDKAIERLISFGDAGATSVLPLLRDTNPDVRTRAGYVLRSFPEIDPRHVTELIAAFTSGNGWLPVALARTGADEALEALWSDFLRNPSQSSNSQVFFALPMFRERLLPRLEGQLKACQTANTEEVCVGALQLLGEFKPFPLNELPLLQEIAASPGATPGAAGWAANELIRQRHSYGLTVLLRSLQQQAVDLLRISPDPAPTASLQRWSDDLDAAQTIRQASLYGDAAKVAGPTVALFIKRPDLPQARAAAALALGKIGYVDGVDALLAQSPNFSDDWLLAYNAVESLGRLRAERARALLNEVAHAHWYQPVRNNAERAIAFLNGGLFARAGVAEDADAPPDKGFYAVGLEIRYLGDTSPPSACPMAGDAAYGQYLVKDIAWPRREHGLELKPIPPSAAETRKFYAAYPSFRKHRGDLMFAAAMGKSLVVGTNAGEFGGEVYAIDDSGREHLLIAQNALAAFKSGSRLFVLTGLSHLATSSGDLWIMELRGGHPVVQRRVQLPIEPDRYSAAFRETLVIAGHLGDLAIRSDGELIHPQQFEECR